MTSSRGASFLTSVTRRQSVWGLWKGFENGLVLGTLGDFHRHMMSSVSSSRYYEDDDAAGCEETSPSQAWDGIANNDSKRKQKMKSNGQARAESPFQSRKSLKSEESAAEREDQESFFMSPSELSFASDTLIPVTSYLHIVTPEEDTPRGVWPIFRIMDEDGTFRDGTRDGHQHNDSITPKLSCEGINGKRSNIDSYGGQNEDNDGLSLSAFRNFLSKRYPNQSLEIERNGLLLPSKLKYTDTDSRNTLERLLRHMVRLREMDAIFQNAQRQGRISFYLTCRGEEGIHFGATSALENQDVILGQYREQGPLMWRGFTLQQFADQCFSNESDLGKGRQMPIHYGSRALNYQTISSPLGTQIPQAVGVALRLKMMDTETVGTGSTIENQNKRAIAICFFGEGCSSTTDFHSGLNFAATLKCPVIFFCRNNGYAISTSAKEQYASDGVVSKAPAYGMAGIRVDGNDVFAVHAAVREARAYAIENNAPVLIEAMSYRQGHHSTSDDSSQYRSIEEVEHFSQKSDPLDRLLKFLKVNGYGEALEDNYQLIIQEEKEAILDALRKAERKPKPPVEALFTDVYKEMPHSLESQQSELREHMAKYPDSYDQSEW